MNYNFQQKRQAIIQEGKNYGVALQVINDGSFHGKLAMPANAQLSDSVKKYLARKVDTYNKHSTQGY
jgi:hypothetical protein